MAQVQDWWRVSFDVQSTRRTPSVRKYLSSKWIKEDVSRTKIHLDTSSFIHFDDNYFRTEGVVSWGSLSMLKMHKYPVYGCVTSRWRKKLSCFPLGRCPGNTVSSFVLFISEFGPEAFAVLNLLPVWYCFTYLFLNLGLVVFAVLNQCGMVSFS